VPLGDRCRIQLASVECFVDDALDQRARIMRSDERDERAADVLGEAGGCKEERVLRGRVARASPFRSVIANGERLRGRHARDGIGAFGIGPGSPACNASPGARGVASRVGKSCALDLGPRLLPFGAAAPRRLRQSLCESSGGAWGNRTVREDEELEKGMRVEGCPRGGESEVKYLQRAATGGAQAAACTRLPRCGQPVIEYLAVAALGNEG
jgi:hypothetical protein